MQCVKSSSVSTYNLLSATGSFYSAIHDDIFKLQPLGSLLHERGEAAIRLLRNYCGQMLLNRLPRAFDKVSTSVRMMVVALIKKTGSVQDHVRERYTRDVCEAITVTACSKELFEMIACSDTNIEQIRTEMPSALPAVFIAFDELRMLRNSTRSMNDLLEQYSSDILNCPMYAAVANGRIEAIK